MTLIISPNILEAQKAELMLVKHFPNEHAEISITDSYFNPLIDNTVAQYSDTLFFHLKYDQKFYLQLDNYRMDSARDEDAPLISLYINNVPVMFIHSGIEPGDYSWPFYTGIDKPRLRIVGGTSVSIRDYPWQVFISTGDYLCGGTIIADKWVITAAHCLYDEDNNRIPDEDISFLAGTNRPFREDPDGVQYDISYAVIHEDYNPDDFGNDLALLRTKEVIEHEFVRPINLITEEEVEQGISDPGAEAIITGWGLTSLDPLRFPDNLQRLKLPIVTDELAQVVWGPLPENVLMAGYINGSGDACSGDSGGPLIVQSGNEYKLAGITSWGSSDCNSIGGYVRLSNFLGWLRKNTGIGQDEFRTVRPVGDDFRCENTVLEPSTRQYVSDTLQNAISYEWKIEPSKAGILTSNGSVADVDWNSDFTGEAYISARALTSEGFTNWAGQRVLTSPVTQVVSQSQDTSICIDSPLNLNILAEGTDLIYNWFKDGDLIKSGKESFFLMAEANESTSAIYYSEIIGECGTVVSEPIDVGIFPSTEIVSQSMTNDLTLMNGSDLNLNVVANGHELDYTWFKDDVPIPDDYNNELLLESINANATGNYKVEVTGTCGTDISNPVYVFVDPEIPDFPKGVNIWPTLTSDIVNIAVEKDDIFDIYIYDSKGVRVGSKIFCQYQVSISLNHLGPDLYFIQLRFDNESKIYKVVKLK